MARPKKQDLSSISDAVLLAEVARRRDSHMAAIRQFSNLLGSTVLAGADGLRRKPGRPPGSKNKSTIAGTAKRGRPPGRPSTYKPPKTCILGDGKPSRGPRFGNLCAEHVAQYPTPAARQRLKAEMASGKGKAKAPAKAKAKASTRKKTHKKTRAAKLVKAAAAPSSDSTT